MENNYTNQEPSEYSDDLFDDPLDSQGNSVNNPAISWQASEYIHHHKTALWYIIFGIVTLLLAVGFFIVLRDISILILTVVMSATLFVYANRQPRTLRYALSDTGLTIGEQSYTFGDFKSFSIMQDNGIFSVELDPLQRFKPAVSIFFDAKDGEQIVDILSSFLPAEQKDPDFIDRLIRLARF